MREFLAGQLEAKFGLLGKRGQDVFLSLDIDDLRSLARRLIRAKSLSDLGLDD